MKYYIRFKNRIEFTMMIKRQRNIGVFKAYVIAGEFIKYILNEGAD